MVTKTNEKLTKKYVDESIDTSIDTQRQYAETLFSKAEGRVKVILDTMVEQKLKNALETIRPAFKPECSPVVGSVKTVTLREANEEMLDILKQQLVKIAYGYFKHSGFRLDAASFIWDGDVSPKINFTVINSPTC
jgi:hypothetical protein